MLLDAASAWWWHQLHIILLPIFPLLGFAPWVLMRRLDRPILSWIAAALGFIYAAFYSALDILAGIGAGHLAMLGQNASIAPLYEEGNALATIGVWAYLAASVLAITAAFRRAKAAAIPGAILVLLGAISFMTSHIFWPRGVFTMLELALGWSALVYSVRRGNAPGLTTS